MKKAIHLTLCALLLCVVALSVSAEARVLNIAVQEHVIDPLSAENGRCQYALKALEEKYPGIEVRLHSLPMPDAQALLLEGKYDILLLLNPDAQALKEAGAALPLSDHEGIAEAVKSWPAKVLSPAEDGKLYTMPHWAKPVLCRIASPKLFRELQLDLPDRWTWEDLFAIAPKLTAYNSRNGTSYRLLGPDGGVPYFLTQLAAAKQLPERPVIEALFSGYKSLREAGLIVGLPEDQPRPLFEIALSNTENEADFLPLPLYAQDGPGSELAFFSLVVSPAGQMKEAALDFVAAYAQNEALKASQKFAQSGIYPPGSAGISEAYARAIEDSFPRADRELLSRMASAYLDFESGASSLSQAVDAALIKLAKTE